MVKNHLKTMASPKTWNVKRKGRIFILRPHPGPHSLKNSVSLNFLLIEILKLAKTKKESNYILHNKEIAVDGKKRKSISFPVGLFDLISIKDIKKNFRIIINKKGKLGAIEIDDKEASLKPYKIADKKLVGKMIQLNLFDGSNLLVDKDDYKVGDTLLIEPAKKEIKQHLKLEKGNTIFLTGGRHLGEIGTIEDISGNKIIYKMQSSEVYETLKKYAFVIGTDKPIIKLNEQ